MPRNLLIAFLVTWVIHIGYVLVLRSGYSRLRHQIEQLKKTN